LSVEVRPCASTEELVEALKPIGHYFGVSASEGWGERAARWLELDRVLGASGPGAIGEAAEVRYGELLGRYASFSSGA